MYDLFPPLYKYSLESSSRSSSEGFDAESETPALLLGASRQQLYASGGGRAGPVRTLVQTNSCKPVAGSKVRAG